MEPTLHAGDTFLAQRDPNDKEHLYVVLNDPTDRSLIVAAVNLNTAFVGADTTTLLEPGDHPFVRRETYVNYARATLLPAQTVAALIEAGTFRRMPPCSPVLLERVRLGLFESEFTPNKVVRFCQELF